MLPMIRAALACAVLLGATTHAAIPSQRNAQVYVDPRLDDVHSATVSTIVTGTGAADLVARVGGTTTADLWLIDAVSAVIPTDAIGRLAANPAVRSIVLNDRVQTTSTNDAIGARRVNSVTTLSERMLAPGAALAEGGFVGVGEWGKVTLYGQDGKVSRTFDLPDGSYKKSPLVTGDTVVVVSEANVAYAFDRSGNAVWQRALGGVAVQGSLVAGSGDLIYAVDRNATLHALDGATGATVWMHTVPNTTATATPAVDADGTVYYGTANGTVVAVGTQGAVRWTASVGGNIALTPVIGQDDAVFVTSTAGKFVAALDAASGITAWRFNAAGQVKANPAVAADGTIFFGTDNGYAYAVKVDGTQRWRVRPSTGRFATSPLLSRDGALVYFAQTEDPLFAFDTTTGMKRWSYGMSGSIVGAPVLDADDGIVVGSDGGELVRLDDDGRATFKIKNQGDVTQAATTSADGAAMIRLDEQKVMTIGRLPDAWDGRPDARATGDPKVWDVVNPAAIDTGAHNVHLANHPITGKPLRGAGVTVAVVDSGMYFDPNVRSTLGSVLSPLFKGQADFVDDTCVGLLGIKLLCLANFNGSVDPYGHGTAVSSIIWNNWTDANTGSKLGIAPDANIMSVRVLDENGAGTYENVIEGIQYVVANRLLHNIRVMNVSISAPADIPYFADPLNRAVESAWASGIVVVVAAGNDGSNAESIGAPGNDPYVITVGAVNANRTPGHWEDDTLPAWSANGPTGDGFVKPDILASGSNVLTMMYRDPNNFARSQRIVQLHPDQSLTTSLFRMNGTSMSAPIVSGVAALMLQANPLLTPDQVKYRLMTTARPSTTADGNALTYNSFQQGAGRVWAPDAVLGSIKGSENSGMDILVDLATGYLSDLALLSHYQGPAQKILSDDGQMWLYYAEGGTEPDVWLGFADATTMDWLDQSEVELQGTTWDEGQMRWGLDMRWEGGISTASGQESEGAGRMSWGTGRMSWGTGRMSWGTGRMSWGTGRMSWGTGRMSWGTSVSLDEPVYPTLIADR